VIKRLLLLNGLAILAVVCNHAAAWGYTAMFWWADRYRPVTAPNFDQIGTLPYYGLLAIQQLAVFSVPAFLFVSGFFVSYAARAKSALSWKMVITRIRHLLVPYVIWSGVIFVADALQGTTYAPVEYLERLVFGRATAVYFYIPVICQFYLLSPLVIPIARTRGKLILVVSALLQLGIVGSRYLIPFGVETPALDLMIRVTPCWSFPRWAFFFAFGLVSGFHLARLKYWLHRLKWGLFVAVVVLGVLDVLEPEVLYHTIGKDWGWGRGLFTISSNLYAVAFILCFLAFDKVTIPGSKMFHQLGRSSFSIYLLHPKVLEFAARVIRQIAPLMLAHQVVFQPLLVVLAIGGPLLFMTTVSRSPARRFYRHLFG
jgi:peptidoglycan/LPS O-acetylase OafA/YrhL